MSVDDAFRIAPPPEPGELNRRALEEEGKKRYLSSLERRLQQLEGAKGKTKPLTSKDMLRSLQQTRENHMRLFVSSDGFHGRSTQNNSDSTEADNVGGANCCGVCGGGEAEEHISPQHSNVNTHPSSLICPRWKNYDEDERETLVTRDEYSLTWQSREGGAN